MRGPGRSCRKERGQAAGVFAQLLRCPGRQQDRPRARYRRAAAVLRRPVLLQQDMGVGTTEAERTDPRPARQHIALAVLGGQPGPALLHDIEGAAVERDIGVECFAVQALEQHLVLELQQDLDHASNPGGQLEVPDVRFHRTHAAIPLPRFVDAQFLGQFAERHFQAVDLDRIAQFGTGAVGLDIADAPRIDTGLAIGRFQQLGLGPRVGRGQGVGLAAVIFHGAANQGVDVIAVGLSLGALLQHDHPDPFAAGVAVGLGREGLAAPVERQHARFVETDLRLGSDQGIHAADDRHPAIAVAHCLDSPMDRHQRRGAGSFDRLAGAMQVEQKTHPVGADRRHHRRGAVSLDRHAGLGDQAAVAGHARADEYPGIAARQVGGGIAGVFDRQPGIRHQQALLRIHQLSFPRRDSEEQRVEVIDAVDEAAPLDVRLVGLTVRVAVILAPVPAAGGDLADTVAAVL